MTGTLELEDVTVRFGSGRTALTAVDAVSLRLPANQVLGVVGESGSGKSTLARAIVGLAPISSGRIRWDGHERTPRNSRRAQLVFQNPQASLDPRMTVGATLAEALARKQTTRASRAAAIAELMDLVALPRRYTDLLPRNLSGGQQQRVAIARALAAEPDVLVADEITSALDVSVQGVILNLLCTLREQLGFAVLFISHNLSVVRYVSDRVAVMYLGRVVETAETDRLVSSPSHPYTRTLLEAVPRLDTALSDESAEVEVDPPDPHEPPSGCHFHPRCPIRPVGRVDRDLCVTADPRMGSDRRRHLAMCHFAAAAAPAVATAAELP